MATIQRARTPVTDLMSKLGMPETYARQQTKMLSKNSVGVLENLRVGYRKAMLGRGVAARFKRVMSGKGRLPQAFQMQSPQTMLPVMAPISGGGHSLHFKQDYTLGTKSTSFKRLFNPRRRTGAKLERLLRTNHHARSAFEGAVGGRIVGYGRRDGRLKVQRHEPGFQPIPSMAHNPMANTALGALASMEHAILAQARKVAGAQSGLANTGGAGSSTYGNPLNGIVLSGLSGIAASGMGATYGSALGGGGVGSWNPLAQPGNINNTNPLYERAHQSEVDGVLNDPSLTVEDKVTLTIMLIMNKMDDDIQRQAQYVNSIQQQQSNRRGIGNSGGKVGSPMGKIGAVSTGAMGGPGSGKLNVPIGGKLGGSGESPSIDVETLKLKRMIDKRTQLFDTLRSIIDKYNETAKNIIQSIGR